MTGSRLAIGERIVLTLWVGGLWTIGFMVAPALFANLEDRALAGTLAAVMFEIIAWIGLASGLFLLLVNQIECGGRRINWRTLVLLLMLLLVAVGQFVLAPMIGELRVAGEADSPAFARLHGIASLLYLLTSLLGLALVIAPGSRQPDPGKPSGTA
jgi:hypothetical protein